MERCEKAAFELAKMPKMNITRNKKINYVTVFFLSVVSSSIEKLYLSLGVRTYKW